MKYQAKTDKALWDKFIVSLRVKEELCGDEPGGPWWGPDKWAPAARMLNILDGLEAGLSKSASFVHLQQLLERRNVVAPRVETQRLSLR